MRNYKKPYKPNGHVVGHVTEAVQRLSEELRTHLCGVQSFFCLVFGTGQHTGLPTYKFCNCAIMLVVLELFVCTSWGEAHIQKDLQYKHNHKHESHMAAQTSRHTIQAQEHS